MPEELKVLLLDEPEFKSWWQLPTRLCFGVWVIVSLVIICIGVGATILIIQSTDSLPTVLTTCGPVQGYYMPRDDVFVYRGIPYAAPPLGKMRFRRPVALNNQTPISVGKCWNGVLHAVHLSTKICARYNVHGGIVGSEDCLMLDVYTPAPPKPKPDTHPLVPVVVLMDAGPIMGAANASPQVKMVTRTQLVYVRVQFRLGLLGFMASDMLGANQTGNYGVWDQIEALRWVQDNIAQFGGDPKQVTVMFQSSGDISGIPLVTTTKSAGLFQRAWLFNPSIIIKPLSEAKKTSNSTITRTKCLNAHCLRKIPMRDLLMAAGNTWQDSFIFDLPRKDDILAPNAVIDGDLLTDDPLTALSQMPQHHPGVSLLIGTIAEISKFAIDKVKDTSEAQFKEYISTFIDTFRENISSEAIDVYNFTKQDLPLNKLAQMISDTRVGCALSNLTSYAARTPSSSIYRYIVTHRPSSRATSDGLHYRSDGWDAMAFFGLADQILQLPETESDINFINTMQTMGLQFIHTGKAGWGKAPNYTDLIGEQSTILFDQYHKAQCEFWNKAGILDYAWIN